MILTKQLLSDYCNSLFNDSLLLNSELAIIIDLLLNSGCRMSEIFDDRFYYDKDLIKLLPKKSNNVRVFQPSIFSQSTQNFIFNRNIWRIFSHDTALRYLRSLNSYKKTFVKSKCIDFHVFRYNYITKLFESPDMTISQASVLLGYQNDLMILSYKEAQIIQY